MTVPQLSLGALDETRPHGARVRVGTVAGTVPAVGEGRAGSAEATVADPPRSSGFNATMRRRNEAVLLVCRGWFSRARHRCIVAFKMIARGRRGSARA